MKLFRELSNKQMNKKRRKANSLHVIKPSDPQFITILEKYIQEGGWLMKVWITEGPGGGTIS